jgi:putative Mg2+ transporter-C (MgtC) family protein
MDPVYPIAESVAGSVIAGSLIGLERTFHGRPAGFRTHALVCVTSCVLMLLPAYPAWWVAGTTTLDPTRMAQGIMTGIGFLGAGVIYQEGATVRGLTTAASIWLTAAIGILFGVGFWMPAVVSTLLGLGILAAFRWLEALMPVQSYAQHIVRFHRADAMPEEELRGLLAQHGFVVFHVSYRLVDDGRLFEYGMVVRTTDPSNLRRLAEVLRGLDRVREFRISPTGD